MKLRYFLILYDWVCRGSAGELPLDHRCSPGESGAKNDQQNEITTLNPSLLDGFIQCNGYRSGGRVAILVQIHKHLLGFNPQPFTNGIDDATIGLVRDDALNLGDIDLATTQCLSRRRMHGGNGILEGFFAIHSKKVKS